MADVLKKQHHVKLGSVTGTTSTNGILYASDVNFDDITLINCWASNSNSVIPFKNDSTGSLGFRVVNTSGGSWSIVTSQARTVYYTYIEQAIPTGS